MSVLMQAAARFIINDRPPEDDKDAQLNEIIARGINLQGFLNKQKGITLSGDDEEDIKHKNF